MSNNIKTVWVFHGEGGRFTGGVFTSFQRAEIWIKLHSLSGVLTEYPIDNGVYDWAIDNDYFEIKKETQTRPLFIQNFTSAGQAHFHFQNGERG